MVQTNTRKYITGLIALFVLLIGYSSAVISQPSGTANDPKEYTHTVLAEEPTATWCGYCPTVAQYMDNIWDSYEYDWNFIALVDDKNTYAAQRNDELGVTGFPSVYYDGGYMKIVGAGAPQSQHESAIDTCGARDVADIDIDLIAGWLGDNELSINFEITNNEASTYEGHVHVYVTENHSRWWVQTVQYRFAFIGNYAFNSDVDINAGATYHEQVSWDGDQWGFDDLSPDNLRVIVVAFDRSTDYVDESKGMEPTTNFAPTCGFTYAPEVPEALETVTFTDTSSDVDGTIVSWDWNFGDGGSSTIANPTHSYATKGYYTVSLTVEDDDGATTFYSETIVVTAVGETLKATQLTFDRGFPIRHALDGDWGAAQSFNLLSGSITSTDIYLRKSGSPQFDLTVELRENNPEGTLLDTLVFTPAQVSESWNWLNLDFGDVTIDPGTTYYIVCPPAPPGGTTSFGYEWGYAFGDQYDDGAFWFTRNSGDLWRDLPTMYDFVFSVFGL